MSQKALDNLLLLALFLVVIGDGLAFFIEIKNQRQECEKQKSEQLLKKELCELHNEIKLLKIANAQKHN